MRCPPYDPLRPFVEPRCRAAGESVRCSAPRLNVAFLDRVTMGRVQRLSYHPAALYYEESGTPATAATCFDEGFIVSSSLLDKRETRIRTMFGNIARRYDLLNHLLSLNIDRYWRWRTTRAGAAASS